MTKVAIKDTSITDLGAFNLMIHCDNLHTLEFSQDTFLQQLLQRISHNYSLTKTVFQLRNLFLQVNKPTTLINVVRSLPKLEVGLYQHELNIDFRRPLIQFTRLRI